MDKFLSQTISDDDYRAMKSKLLNKQQELNERLFSLKRADDGVCVQIEEIGKLLKKPVTAYFLGDDEDKRRLAKSLMEKFEWVNENLSIRWQKDIQIVAARNENTPKLGGSNFGSATGNRTPI